MKFFLMLLTLISYELLATDTVRLYDPTQFQLEGTTSASFTLVSEVPSAGGVEEDAPSKIYLPIQSGVTNQLNYSTLKVSAGVNSLFNIASSTHSITFPFLLTVGGTQKYIYVAVRGGATGTAYYVSAKSTLAYSDQSDSRVNFSISPSDICKSVILNSISSVCNSGSGALDSSSTTTVLFKPMLYFFMSDETLAVDGGTTIDPTNASYSGGVYFEAQMSNRLYDSSAVLVSLTALKKGDSRLIGTYSSSATIDTSLFRKVIVYQYDETDTAITSNEPIALASAGSILSNDVSTQQSGEFTLNGLTNGRTYKISIAFQDKFLFATTLSTSQSASPTEIQELLKKQACYILTAGFGEEHFVTNYFRAYRDQVLMKSWSGQMLIKAYYATAPHYALFIYQSETLRFLVRFFAYSLYYLLNFAPFLVLIFLSSLFFLNILRKNKVQLRNNRL